MQEVREWWGGLLQAFLSWLAELWARFVDGVLYDWNVTYFIFVMGAILVFGLIHLWRRRV